MSRPQGHSAIGRILCQWKIPLTPAGIEPATFRFVARRLNHCADRNEYQEYFLWCRADNLVTSMCRLSTNFGCHSLLEHQRSVQASVCIALYSQEVNRDCSVRLGYGLDMESFESRRWRDIFLFSKVFRPAVVPTAPPIQWVPGLVFLLVKRPGNEWPSFEQVIGAHRGIRTITWTTNRGVATMYCS